MGATEQTQEGFRARRMGGTSLAGTKTSFSPGAEGEAVCEEDPEAASTPSTSKWAALHVAPRMLS